MGIYYAGAFYMSLFSPFTIMSVSVAYFSLGFVIIPIYFINCTAKLLSKLNNYFRRPFKSIQRALLGSSCVMQGYISEHFTIGLTKLTAFFYLRFNYTKSPKLMLPITVTISYLEDCCFITHNINHYIWASL